jgi:DNA polymerase-3 subunit alpha
VESIEQLRQVTRSRLQCLITSRSLYDSPFVYLRRLEYELGVFDSSGYADVILIISDYIQWAKRNNIIVGPGRGSAAGSLVVYLAGITTIDPLRYDLIFERFLNPERVSLPDIDTDFSDRDRVIGYIRDKYGHNRVAKVGVPSLYKPRSAIDELSKAFGLTFKDTKTITKLIDNAKTFDEAFKNEPGLLKSQKQYPQMFEMAHRLLGYVRQITTHPSAVILCRGPIGAEIPLQKPPGQSSDGQLATGWDGEELDNLGYVKLDILTVDNLSIVGKSIDLINIRHGVQVDFYDLPLDDEHALQGFTEGETVAVFQMEERKTVGILKGLPDITFEEICAVNALIRPGLDVRGFIKARNTGNVSYAIPELEPILSPTFGVILYQEQVMRMCVDLAGFTMAKADKVRKIIAKTSNQQSTSGLTEVHDDFKNGYIDNGLDPSKFDALWKQILSCQQYIFNSSHAHSYGAIAYADMYLKRHYPLEFMCAALITRSREIYIKECDRLGIRVLQPDVNKSGVNYQIEGDSIRMGLSCVKHVGSKAQVIVDRQPYSDAADFVDRSRVGAKLVASLCYAGALDCFGERGKVVKALVGQDQDIGQSNLALNEKDMLGFYLVHDPLRPYADKLKGCTTPQSIRQPKRGKVGGIITRFHIHDSRPGFQMAFVTLLTVGGNMDVLVWPDELLLSKKMIEIGRVILAKGSKTQKGVYALSAIELLNE